MLHQITEILDTELENAMNSEYQQSVFSKIMIVTFSSKVLIRVMLCVVGLSIYSGKSFAEEDASLEAIEGTVFSSFKMADEIAIPTSRKIYIETIEAKFSDTWIAEFRRKTTRNYREDTLQIYAEAFRLHIGEILTESGWIVLSGPESGALRVNAKLLDIHINAPEIIHMVDSLVLNIGSANLDVSIYGADQKLALHIKDARITGSPMDSYMQSNRTLNFQRFDKMFYGWANNMTVYLNLVSEIPTTS